jgi:hypothetical protein
MVRGKGKGCKEHTRHNRRIVGHVVLNVARVMSRKVGD